MNVQCVQLGRFLHSMLTPRVTKSSLHFFVVVMIQIMKLPIHSPWDVKFFIGYSWRYSKIQGVVLPNTVDQIISWSLRSQTRNPSLCLTTIPRSGGKTRIVKDLGTQWSWGVNLRPLWPCRIAPRTGKDQRRYYEVVQIARGTPSRKKVSNDHSRRDFWTLSKRI